MKKLVLTALAPVLALFPQAASAKPDACKVGKQVFEFRETGKSVKFVDGKPVEKLPPDAYFKFGDIVGQRGEMKESGEKGRGFDDFAEVGPDSMIVRDSSGEAYFKYDQVIFETLSSAFDGKGNDIYEKQATCVKFDEK